LNIEGFPEAVRSRAALAETYAASGQKDLAIETYKEILKLDPKNPNAQRRIEELSKAGK
jgi:Tfp pilus assembly protein PilF